MNSTGRQRPGPYEWKTRQKKMWLRRLAVLWLMPFFAILCLPSDADAFAIRVLPSIIAVQSTQTPPQLLWTIKADNLLRHENDRFHIADIVGVTGQAARVQLELPPFRPTDYLLLSFRGLPKDFTLSSGFRTSDAWLVSAHESKGLQIMPPDNFEGSFTTEVRLIRGQNVVARTNVVRITFSAPRKTATRPPPEGKNLTATIPEAVTIVTPLGEEQISGVQTEAAPLPPINAEQEKYMLGLAQEMLDQNDVAAARSIYRRLAYQKSRRGTLRLAQSYDPAFLSQFRTANNLEDLEKARHWYRRAADLGADAALQRLTALDMDSE